MDLDQMYPAQQVQKPSNIKHILQFLILGLIVLAIPLGVFFN